MIRRRSANATLPTRWFARSTLILFLNKIDLFAAKLPTSSLRAAFPMYRGDDEDYAAATAFILQQFKQLYSQPKGFYVSRFKILCRACQGQESGHRRFPLHLGVDRLSSTDLPARMQHHFTNATDSKGLQVVMNAVQDTILQEMLASAGILE